MTYEGETALDGSFPVNMSGGVLSSNPIGASGLLRFAESALQVRGPGGRTSGGWSQKGTGTRLWRRLPILFYLGSGKRKALTGSVRLMNPVFPD